MKEFKEAKQEILCQILAFIIFLFMQEILYAKTYVTLWLHTHWKGRAVTKLKFSDMKHNPLSLCKAWSVLYSSLRNVLPMLDTDRERERGRGAILSQILTTHLVHFLRNSDRLCFGFLHRYINKILLFRGVNIIPPPFSAAYFYHQYFTLILNK